MIKYLLDTNIVIYIIKNRPTNLLPKFNHNVNLIAISTITLAELIYGVEKSNYPEKNLVIVEDFISRLKVLSYDENAAFHYGNIKSALVKKGKIIGENDLHIAGHARSKGLIVVTNNIKEFNRVNGLMVENWI